ncbi:TPA: hypothetical protein DCX15_02605, partial [bacterium]|nr:hypothetical protein [bacterium]
MALTLGLVLAGSALWVGATPLRIGFVDISQAFDEYHETKRATSILNAEIEERKTKVDILQEEIAKLKEDKEILEDEEE